MEERACHVLRSLRSQFSTGPLFMRPVDAFSVYGQDGFENVFRDSLICLLYKSFHHAPITSNP